MSLADPRFKIGDFASTGIAKLHSVQANGRDVLSSPFAYEPLTNYGAVSGVDCTAALNLAVASGKKLFMFPAGSWFWTGTIAGTSRMTFLIDPEATFPSLPTVGPYGQTNFDSLGGRIDRQSNASITNQGRRIGDGNPWPELYRPFSVSIGEFTVTSPTGQIALGGFSRSSDNPTVNQGTIGVEGIAVNDDTANIKPVFGGYFESWRAFESVGAALTELEAINLGSVHELNPNTVRSINSKDTIAAVFASGGGVTGAATASAATATWANGATFWRAHVVMAGALDPTGPLEAVAMANTYRVAWYSPVGGLIAWDQADTRQRMSQADADNSGYSSAVKRRKANNTSATDNLDRIFREDFYGFTGSADYGGAFYQVLQRTDFSGGNARFSIDFSANASDGTACQVTLNGLADKSFAPFPANTLSLGTASFDFTEVHARRHYYSATVFDAFGTGTPEGNLAASVGSTFRRTDGGAGTSFYVKETGTGNTGWVGK